MGYKRPALQTFPYMAGRTIAGSGKNIAVSPPVYLARYLLRFSLIQGPVSLRHRKIVAGHGRIGSRKTGGWRPVPGDNPGAGPCFLCLFIEYGRQNDPVNRSGPVSLPNGGRLGGMILSLLPVPIGCRLDMGNQPLTGQMVDHLCGTVPSQAVAHDGVIQSSLCEYPFLFGRKIGKTPGVHSAEGGIIHRFHAEELSSKLVVELGFAASETGMNGPADDIVDDPLPMLSAHGCIVDSWCRCRRLRLGRRTALNP